MALPEDSGTYTGHGLRVHLKGPPVCAGGQRPQFLAACVPVPCCVLALGSLVRVWSGYAWPGGHGGVLGLGFSPDILGKSLMNPKKSW